ncbi:MAG TPA: GerMN domain-containing protein [Candidatus Tumulicola sp.]|nr:GerMN domain-containing protein [Candidatus Tumulicola sp.]
MPACTKKAEVTQSQPLKITVFYCKAGTEELMPVDYTAKASLDGAQVANYATDQLLAGPSVGRDAVALFPIGTQASVTLSGGTATVNLIGPIQKSSSVGTSDEVAMFKALVYTLTGLPNVKEVQVLVGGQKVAALPGGHLELDQPLTRETFAQ